MTEERANADLYEPFETEPQKETSPERINTTVTDAHQATVQHITNSVGTWKVTVTTDAWKTITGGAPDQIMTSHGVDADPDWIAPKQTTDVPIPFRVPGAHADAEILRKYFAPDNMANTHVNNRWVPISAGTVEMPSDFIIFGGGTITHE